MGAFLKDQFTKYVPPGFRSQNIRNALADPVPDDMSPDFPLPTWTFAKKRKDGSFMPQNIAHRGFKAKHPENTMGAFKGAVNCGVDAIETDIHVTRDGVVVLSHDATLKRCFGRDEAIIDCDWDFIKTLRTTAEPHEPMPRLVDLLEFLASDDLEDIWTLLDIKLDVDPTIAMSLIGKAVKEVKPHPRRSWDKRVLLGFWSAKYLPLCKRYLPGFSVTHIGFSSLYARQFFYCPNVCYNMLGKILLLWPTGPSFIKDAHAKNRSVLVWTINEDKMMRWSIKNGLDGVITDDPSRYREVCEEWMAGKREIGIGWKDMVSALWINCLALVLGLFFIHWRKSERKRYSYSDPRMSKALGTPA